MRDTGSPFCITEREAVSMTTSKIFSMVSALWYLRSTASKKKLNWDSEITAVYKVGYRLEGEEKLPK